MSKTGGELTPPIAEVAIARSSVDAANHFVSAMCSSMLEASQFVSALKQQSNDAIDAVATIKDSARANMGASAHVY
jgi:hypothetical protein